MALLLGVGCSGAALMLWRRSLRYNKPTQSSAPSQPEPPAPEPPPDLQSPPPPVPPPSVKSPAAAAKPTVTTGLRDQEVQQVLAALLSQQSVLLLGEGGSGKSVLGERVRDLLREQRYRVAIANYSGAAKETLVQIAEQLDVPIFSDDERPKPLTAEQLRKELLMDLTRPRTVLISDDAHRWSASLRYWLEDVQRSGGLLLLLATAPPAKDIFLKVPRIEMQPLKNDEIRTLMYQEALAYGMTLNPSKFAELQQRAGNNPALAKRVVREELLGISESQSTDHYQYVDGSPFLIAGLSAVGIIRFIGMGLGDKSLYMIGGICTLLAIAFRTLFYAVNRKSSRLGK